MPRKKLPVEEKVMRASMARRKYMDKHQNILVRKSTAEKLEEIGAALNLSLRDTVELLVELHLIKGDPQLLSRLAKKKKKKHKRDKLKASASVYDHFGVSGDASHVLACDMTPAAAAAAAWASGDRDMMASGDLMYDHSYWNVGPSSDELLKKKKRRERKRLKVKASAFVWDPHSGVAGDPLMGSGDLMYDETAWNVGSGSDEVSKNKRKRREPRKLKSSAFVVDELTGISGDRDMVSGDPSYGESGWNGGPAADGLPRSAFEGGGEKLDGAAQSEAINVKIEPEDYDESEICKACCLKFPTPGDFIAHQQLGCVGEKHKDNDAHQQHGSVGRVHKDDEAHSSHSPEPSASQHEETDLQKIPERTEPVHSTQPLREPSASKQEDTDLQKIRERTEPVQSTQPLREPSTSKHEDTDLQKIPDGTEPVHSAQPLREPSASKQEDRDFQEKTERTETVHSTQSLREPSASTQEDTDLQDKTERTEPAEEGGDRCS